MGYAVASVYDDSGQTASGWHATYGLAACGAGLCVPMGARLEVCYHGRCVVATRDDSGPYVSGRDLDLSLPTAGAISFPYGVDTVRYRVLSG